MISLKHPDWEHNIQLYDGSTTLLVIENKEVFRKYIDDLINSFNEDGPFVLSDGLKRLKIKEHVDVVFSPYSISFSDKRLLTRLQSGLKKHMVSESHYSQTMEIISQIEAYASDLIWDYPVSLDVPELDPLGLLKYISPVIQTDYEDDYEKIIEYMNIMHEICGIDDYVLVSMFSYFDSSEIDCIIQDSMSNKHNLLFIESCQPLLVDDNTKVIIIDEDRCELY